VRSMSGVMLSEHLSSLFINIYPRSRLFFSRVQINSEGIQRRHMV
jgi:hypothetical protein